MTTDLHSLALRVEAADGADRELDALIAAACGVIDNCTQGGLLGEPGFRVSDDGRRVEYGTLFEGQWRRVASREPRPFTASLDAAKSIWPHGWWIRVTQARFGMWSVQGWLGDKSTKTEPDIAAIAQSEERARTAAALRARAASIAKEQEND